MRSWKPLVTVVVAVSFVVAAWGIEAAADSHTKPKTEQAVEAGKKTTPPQAETKSKEAGKEIETQPQSGAAGHDGHHEGHEGSHDEELDEGSH